MQNQFFMMDEQFKANLEHPQHTRPGWGGLLVILAVLASPFLFSYLPRVVEALGL
jgi:hypothetical protein